MRRDTAFACPVAPAMSEVQGPLGAPGRPRLQNTGRVRKATLEWRRSFTRCWGKSQRRREIQTRGPARLPRPFHILDPGLWDWSPRRNTHGRVHGAGQGLVSTRCTQTPVLRGKVSSKNNRESIREGTSALCVNKTLFIHTQAAIVAQESCPRASGKGRDGETHRFQHHIGVRSQLPPQGPDGLGTPNTATSALLRAEDSTAPETRTCPLPAWGHLRHW